MFYFKTHASYKKENDFLLHSLKKIILFKYFKIKLQAICLDCDIMAAADWRQDCAAVY